MDDYRIRSYHRAWSPERMLFGFDELKLPRPIPIRFFVYVLPLLGLSLLASHLIGVRYAYDLLPGWARWMLPIGIAWLLTIASIQGRYFHAELWARIRSFGMARWLSGCWWDADEPDEQLQLGRIRILK
jgi:hypothetical protein